MHSRHARPRSTAAGRRRSSAAQRRDRSRRAAHSGTTIVPPTPSPTLDDSPGAGLRRPAGRNAPSARAPAVAGGSRGLRGRRGSRRREREGRAAADDHLVVLGRRDRDHRGRRHRRRARIRVDARLKRSPRGPRGQLAARDEHRGVDGQGEPQRLEPAGIEIGPRNDRRPATAASSARRRRRQRGSRIAIVPAVAVTSSAAGVSPPRAAEGASPNVARSCGGQQRRGEQREPSATAAIAGRTAGCVQPFEPQRSRRARGSDPGARGNADRVRQRQADSARPPSRSRPRRSPSVRRRTSGTNRAVRGSSGHSRRCRQRG